LWIPQIAEEFRLLEGSNLESGSRLRAYATLFRLPNCVMIGLGVLVGEAIGLEAVPSLANIVFGFLTASIMMAGTMALNDIHDFEVDKVNSPGRPLPSGRIGIGEAKVTSVIFAALSIVFAVLLGPWTTLTALLALVLMVYYNTVGKRTGLPGNVVVSFNVALPFFFGGIVVGSLRPLLLVFSILAFLANLGREVAKGIPDAAGDMAQDVRTIAVSHGTKTAARVSAGLFVSAALLSFLPLYLGGVSILYLPVVLLSDAGFVYSATRLLATQDPEKVRRVKNQVLLWMLFGLVGFLLGAVSL
jgi:geranylgeranylglycerol-phosphate geranylgeranyltransferase